MSLQVKLSSVRDNWRVAVAALFITTIAAVLRFYGLSWGLPNAQHQASYHPDEFLIIGTALAVYAGQAVIPRFYNYPSLFIYLVTFAVMWAVGFGMDITSGNIHVAARVVSALMGILAVLVTLWAGYTLCGRFGGFFAALILATAPIHVQHSHFATVDVPSTVFTAAALGFAGLVLKRGSWRDYIYAGVMAGLAAGTKYNAGLVVLAVIAAHFLREGIRWTSLRDARVWAVIGCTFLAFIVSTPGVILRFSDFWYGFSYELGHSASGHGLVFAGTGNGFIYTLTNSFWYGLGPWLTLLFIASIIWAVVRRDKPALLLLAFIIPYYSLVSVSQVRFARYIIPMLPAVALMIGWFLEYWFQRLCGQPRKQSMLFGAAAALVLITLEYTLALTWLFGSPDPRDKAEVWISENVRKNSSIGFIDAPWFYSPPLSPTFGTGALPQREESIQSIPYNVTLFSKCEEQGCWIQDPPEWIIISDYEIGDAIRLQGNKSISADAKAQADRISADMKLIRENYDVRKRFSGTLRRWGNGFSDVSELPHDMRYTAPTITVYERKR